MWLESVSQNEKLRAERRRRWNRRLTPWLAVAAMAAWVSLVLWVVQTLGGLLEGVL